MCFDRRLAIALAAVIALGSCGRGAMTFLPEAAAVGVVTPIFIGTTRQMTEGRFGPGRAEDVRFARYDIAIPPDRDTGEINWPPRHADPDPNRHFLTAAELLFQGPDEFRGSLKHDLALHDGEAVIFVHGYNNNFAEGLYRVAQFAHDLELPGSVVHYAWPSAATALGYVYDRDSTLFARDGLEALIREVEAAGATRILLVAHSMGSALTMEALRQTAIRGNRDVLDRLSGVILISPDLDVDVFRSQAAAIGTLPQPFVIFGSDRDRVLGLSARLTGQSERLGSLSDVTRVADLNVTFMDVSEFSTGAGHFVLGDSAALIRLLDRIGEVEGAFEADRARRVGLVSGAVLTVQNATQIILSPVTQIAAEVAE